MKEILGLLVLGIGLIGCGEEHPENIKLDNVEVLLPQALELNTGNYSVWYGDEEDPHPWRIRKEGPFKDTVSFFVGESFKTFPLQSVIKDGDLRVHLVAKTKDIFAGALEETGSIVFLEGCHLD